MLVLHNHLLTQFSVIVSLKHHFLEWSLMGRDCYKKTFRLHKHLLNNAAPSLLLGAFYFIISSSPYNGTVRVGWGQYRLHCTHDGTLEHRNGSPKARQLMTGKTGMPIKVSWLQDMDVYIKNSCLTFLNLMVTSR